MVKPLTPNRVHLEKDLVVKKSKIPLSGKGLFTKIDIEKHTVITEFFGEKISHTLAMARAINKESYSTIYYNKKYSIDSVTDKNCLATYMNDANGAIKDRSIKNNVFMLRANGRIYVLSKRIIYAGEELYMAYGVNYWKGIEHFNILKFKNEK